MSCINTTNDKENCTRIIVDLKLNTTTIKGCEKSPLDNFLGDKNTKSSVLEFINHVVDSIPNSVPNH